MYALKDQKLIPFSQLFLLVLLLTGFSGQVNGQASDDPTLFWVDDEAVPTSEFVYIYNKNNGGTAKYSREAVREYLNLYENFKLKVHHARQMKLDTIDRLKHELAGYREQLATTYLNDNSVMGRLASEAYKRMQKEAEVSHILIRTPKEAVGQDTIEAYAMAMNIYNALTANSSNFEDIARAQSQDTKNKEEGGYIGYVQAILPKGYYALETAIYQLEPGQISRPVRSPRGYHIVKLHGFRSARQEVEIAHILVKKQKNDPQNEATMRRVIDIQNRLERGVPFEEMAAKESDDDKTARKGGRIGFIKTGEYEPAFEEAAFALKEDGEISQPVETRIGFHILKRLGVKENLSFKDSKRRIENELRQTEREELAQEAMLNRIKQEEHLVVNELNKYKLFEAIDESVTTYRWIPGENLDNDVLLEFGNQQQKNVQHFIVYLQKHPKERSVLARMTKVNALTIMFDDWVAEVCFAIEKENLEEKYPDFAALMREYEEGILLFEITKENVWDRASSDTTGLLEYFEAHRGDYVHPKQIEVTTYTISGANKKSAKKIAKQIKKLSNEDMKLAYPNIPQDVKIVKEGADDASQYAWTEGGISDLRPLGTTGQAFLVSETTKVIPEVQKQLSECRGYVIADYQEQLEKSWLKELKSKYELKENKAAFEQLIQSSSK